MGMLAPPGIPNTASTPSLTNAVTAACAPDIFKFRFNTPFTTKPDPELFSVRNGLMKNNDYEAEND
jgi:hypothetical protein